MKSIEAERERKRLSMAKKRSDPEIRAALNARRRELAQRPEAKQKDAERQKDWKSKNSEKVSAYQKQWREKNADYISEYQQEYQAKYREKDEVQFKTWVRNLHKNYKITPAIFNKMWEDQNGKCAICEQPMNPRGREKSAATVDHNHETGKVRGLLCRGCNHGIGNLKDDPSVLQSAAEYLIKNGFYSHLKR
jgi:hypothetical protein